MDVKKKFADLKEKLARHSDEIITFGTTVAVMTPMVLAYHYKRKLKLEGSRHAECHDFARWIEAHLVVDQTKKQIWREGTSIYIKPIETEE